MVNTRKEREELLLQNALLIFYPNKHKIFEYDEE